MSPARTFALSFIVFGYLSDRSLFASLLIAGAVTDLVVHVIPWCVRKFRVKK
jgi:hypothetical protein